MGFLPITERYDKFQNQAVLAVTDDYRNHPNGRFLLVIPTAGGKTITAVKSINQLFAQGILSPEEDTVLWIAHREELIDQAEDAFPKFVSFYPDLPSFGHRVVFRMISQAAA